MDFSAVGKKIKELRKNIGLSQEELSEGICTQAQISKIEKGIVFPYASTLYLISQKLGVDVNYFFDIGMTPRLDYVQEVEKQLKIARREHRFNEMMEIVKAEEENPLFAQNTKNSQNLLWHKGIYFYEVEKDVNKAIKTMEEAIEINHSVTKVYTEREIEILLSIGAILGKENLEKALLVFEEISERLKHLPHFNDYTIKTRHLYNYSRVLTRLNQLKESSDYCEKGIKWCLEKDSLYLLGQLHYQIGYNHELLGNNESAKKYMQKALVVFELQNDHVFSPLIRNKIEELTELG
ncbi:helix-turn-helix domain-containing protein [Rossellomorea marisflavi]|uniref:helix-turn-helix domain-containing protein n=1 Tax=Rossellomorea marisflavi TaxID=189381 RepID=UPI003ADCE208